MPIFEYKCDDCKIIVEKIYPSLEKSHVFIDCPKCKSDGMKRLGIPSSVSLSRSKMDNSPIDNAIGRDAEARWTDIKARQESRDNVRLETGSIGLTEVERGKFAPISSDQVETRTEINNSLTEGKRMESGIEATNSWLSSVD